MTVLHKFMVTIKREGSSLAEIQWIDAETESEAIAMAKNVAAITEGDTAHAIKAAIHDA